MSEVTKNYPPLKLRVFVDDITALLMVKNKEVAEMAKKVMKNLQKMRWRGKDSDRGREGMREQDDGVVWLLGE